MSRDRCRIKQQFITNRFDAMNTEYVYMKISKDRYELPVAVANSAYELAKICGVTNSTVCRAIRNREQKGSRSKYVRVLIDKEN